MSEQDSFRGWVILEVLGHRTLGGFLSEQVIAGAAFLRIDIPSEPATTQLYAPNAVYAITPTTEAVATAFAQRGFVGPVQTWELEPPRRQLVEAMPSRVGVIDHDFEGELDDGDEPFDPATVPC